MYICYEHKIHSIMPTIKKIGVLTSGGDTPGMNAAIRAIVKAGNHYGIEIVGIQKGFFGLIHDKMQSLDSRAVYNIIHRGGTILKSARCEEFKTKKGRETANKVVKKNSIDALILIGGDGTLTGGKLFGREFDVPVIGLPGTIDNDLYGTDYTIGYDTAVNTVVTAVDKIRDTAHSHDRLFIVEVMGRDAGFIALRSGIATGAEKILIPEAKTFKEDLLESLKKGIAEDETSGIIIVAEGDDTGGAREVEKIVRDRYPDYDIRVSILGHIQRGGAPSAYDRVLASGLGYQAVKGLTEGKRDVMVGSINRQIVFTPLDKTIKYNSPINVELHSIAEILGL